MEKEYYEEEVQHQTEIACAWLVCHSHQGLCKLYPPYPASPEARAPSFFGKPVMRARIMAAERQLLSGDIESKPGPKPTLRPFDTHSLNPPHSINTLIHESNPLNPPLSQTHSLPNSPTSVQSHLPPLQNTPTYHRASIQLHTLIYLKQHTGTLDVSREDVASASRVETYWVVGHSTATRKRGGSTTTTRGSPTVM